MKKNKCTIVTSLCFLIISCIFFALWYNETSEATWFSFSMSLYTAICTVLLLVFLPLKTRQIAKTVSFFLVLICLCQNIFRIIHLVHDITSGLLLGVLTYVFLGVILIVPKNQVSREYWRNLSYIVLILLLWFHYLEVDVGFFYVIIPLCLSRILLWAIIYYICFPFNKVSKEKEPNRSRNTFKHKSFVNKRKIQDDKIEELKQLKDLLDNGAITQEEFDAKKKQILGL